MRFGGKPGAEKITADSLLGEVIKRYPETFTILPIMPILAFAALQALVWELFRPQHAPDGPASIQKQIEIEERAAGAKVGAVAKDSGIAY